jgi:hypothetical protein
MDSVTDQLAAESPVALPVIRGGRWFGPEPRPFLLRVELPLMLEEMVAALYGVVQPEEIDSDEDLCGCVAVTLLIEGLPALAARAARLRKAEQSGTVESPEFLDLCRQRVAALLAR